VSWLLHTLPSNKKASASSEIHRERPGRSQSLTVGGVDSFEGDKTVGHHLQGRLPSLRLGGLDLYAMSCRLFSEPDPLVLLVRPTGIEPVFPP
jgi:hypothetical protein